MPPVNSSPPRWVRLLAWVPIIFGLVIVVLALVVLQQNTRAHLPVGVLVAQLLLGLGLIVGSLHTALQLKQRAAGVAFPLLGLILTITALIVMIRSA